MMKEITVFCPATIANLSCGFDVLGLALDSVGDEMRVRRTETKGISFGKLSGQKLPTDPKMNVAAIAGEAFIAKSGYTGGFTIDIIKNIKPGSGIGSSAASSAGAVWAMNTLLGEPLDKNQLITCAMEGEKLAGGIAHADNVAPALLGGITLVRSYDPLDIISIHTPDELFAAVVHPQIEVKTVDSRKILKDSISLRSGIRQWGNLGGFIAGLYKEDYELIGRCLEDHIFEPVRSILIPGFDLVKQKAGEAGALGSGISGSGPSIFALCRGEGSAKRVAKAMAAVYEEMDIDHDVHISAINRQGVRKISST